MKKYLKILSDSKYFLIPKIWILNILSKTNITLWAKLHSGQYLKVDLSSTVGRSIYLRGFYEVAVEKYIRENLKPGDVFIDIGANVGYFTIIASGIVGKKGEVHSFDPHKNVNALLSESIQRNGYKNIKLNKKALSDKEEYLSFVALKNSAFSWTLPVGKQTRESEEKVSAIPLDKYASSQIKRPLSMIKIDVEGAEVNVLRGAREVLSDNDPAIILEAQDWSLERFGNSIDDIFICLNELGYSAYDLAGAEISNADVARKHLKSFTVQNLVFKKDNVIA